MTTYVTDRGAVRVPAEPKPYVKGWGWWYACMTLGIGLTTACYDYVRPDDRSPDERAWLGLDARAVAGLLIENRP